MARKTKKKSVKKAKSKKTETLNPNEKMFCQLYFGGGEFFGNGTWSYIQAYNLSVPLIAYSYLKRVDQKQYDVAKNGAYRLLIKAHIVKEGDKILDSLFKESVVDRELTKIIMQDKDKMSKNVAIREFNRLKNRVQEKIDLTSKGKMIQPIIKIVEYVRPKTD